MYEAIRNHDARARSAPICNLWAQDRLKSAVEELQSGHLSTLEFIRVCRHFTKNAAALFRKERNLQKKFAAARDYDSDDDVSYSEGDAINLSGTDSEGESLDSDVDGEVDSDESHEESDGDDPVGEYHSNQY